MTKGDELLERVAQSIYFLGREHQADSWNYAQGWHKELAREQARHAIAEVASAVRLMAFEKSQSKRRAGADYIAATASWLRNSVRGS